MNYSVLEQIIKAKSRGDKMLAVLLDPDKVELKEVPKICEKLANKVDFVFVGGSTVIHGDTEKLIKSLKMYTNIPIVLFPGDYTQISNEAHAILFLSLLSGENPEYLIKQQLKSVPALNNMEIEIIPTGYILIDGGNETSVQKVSNTKPIGNDDFELVTITALAGVFMGKQLIYLEAGSGAKNPVTAEIIRKVSSNINVPIIIGGGIRTKEQLNDAYNNGADIVVIGTAFENNSKWFDKV